MPDNIIMQDRLLELSGLKRGQKAALRRHLRKARIPFLELNGNIFTTEEALTDRLAGRAKNREATEPNWDGI